MEFSAPLSGCENLEHFYEENNPMRLAHGNKIPCLVMNALDDPICPKECIRYDLMDQWMNYGSIISHLCHQIVSSRYVGVFQLT